MEVTELKIKGHLICPNCGKETDFVLRSGEALIWCRKCRKYFLAVLRVVSEEFLNGRRQREHGVGDEGPSLQQERAAASE